MKLHATGISSMATKMLLASISRLYAETEGVEVSVTSMGGVDAAAAIRAGADFDFAILAAEAIHSLCASGHLLPESEQALFVSGIAAAVPADAALPDLSTEQSLKETLLAARSIGLSTGPSGKALQELFETLGIADEVRKKVFVVSPGTPVASLIARGELDIGFQQLSELVHVPGIRILRNLPGRAAIRTLFSAAILSKSTRREAAQCFLAFAGSGAAGKAVMDEGMETAPE